MLTRQLITRSRAIAAQPQISSRSFSIAAQRWAGKEDKLHHEGRAEEVEAQKHASLKQQKEGKGEWKEDLGSSSESIVGFSSMSFNPCPLW